MTAEGFKNNETGNVSITKHCGRVRGIFIPPRLS